MKNCLIEKCILVIAAFCLFINSIGLNYLSSEKPIHSKNLQETEISNNQEIKSSVLISFIDSEERNLEFENENDDEENSDNNHLFSFLNQQLIAFYINDFNKFSILNNRLRHQFSLPFYIQYQDFRL